MDRAGPAFPFVESGLGVSPDPGVDSGAGTVYGVEAADSSGIGDPSELGP